MTDIKKLAASAFTNDSNEYDEDIYNETLSELYKNANKALNEIIEYTTRVRLESENRCCNYELPLKYEDYPNYKVLISSIKTGQTIEGTFKTESIVEEESEIWLSRARTSFLIEEAEEIVTNYALNLEDEAENE